MNSFLYGHALLGRTQNLASRDGSNDSFHYTKTLGIVQGMSASWAGWYNLTPPLSLNDGSNASGVVISDVDASHGLIIGFDEPDYVLYEYGPYCTLFCFDVTLGTGATDYSIEYSGGYIDEVQGTINLLTDYPTDYIAPMQSANERTKQMVFKSYGNRAFITIKSVGAVDSTISVTIKSLCYLANVVYLPSEEMGSFHFTPMFNNMSEFTTLSGKTIKTTTAPALFEFAASYKWSDTSDIAVALHNLMIKYINGAGSLVWFPSANAITTALPEYISLSDIPQITREANTVYSMTMEGHTQP